MYSNGAMTLDVMTLDIMTLGKTISIMTYLKNVLNIITLGVRR